MRRPQELIHRRHPLQPVAALRQQPGIAGEARRIARHVDDRRYPGVGQHRHLRLRPGRRRIEHHRVEAGQLAGRQRLDEQVAPLAGEVIVRSVEPGQSVADSDAVIVLSDRLIVRAQVDETDIGKVKKNQAAVITLDAYPGESIRARVDHISYESKMVNNVTTYYVDILPASVPAYFRSGMSANVEIIQQEKTGVLTLPVDAVKESGEGNFVLVPSADGKKPARVNVTTGMTDGTNMEIVAGLKEGDNVFVNGSNYVPVSKAEEGTNPFMPKRSAATRRAH